MFSKCKSVHRVFLCLMCVLWKSNLMLSDWLLLRRSHEEWKQNVKEPGLHAAAVLWLHFLASCPLMFSSRCGGWTTPANRRPEPGGRRSHDCCCFLSDRGLLREETETTTWETAPPTCMMSTEVELPAWKQDSTQSTAGGPRTCRFQDHFRQNSAFWAINRTKCDFLFSYWHFSRFIPPKQSSPRIKSRL